MNRRLLLQLATALSLTIASIILFSACTLSLLQWVERVWFRPEKSKA